jgi:Carboxypeptidase regulatory-like domain
MILRFLVLLLTITFGAFFCSAQVIYPDAQRNLEKFTLSGVVVNSVSNEPIKRALVEIYAQQPRAMLTDSEGHFAFDGLVQGTYSIHARKPGYFTESEISRGRRGEQAMRVGPQTGSVTLKLQPEAIVAGTVLDSDGLPVPRLQIRVLRREIQGGRAQWQASQMRNTDENGEYRIAGLMPGTYVVSAGPLTLPPQLVGRSGGRPVGFRQLFFPNSDSIDSAARFQALAGQHFEANFSLTAEPFYKLRGTYSGDAASVNVMLMSADSAGTPTTVGLTITEGTNQFESEHLPPGNYRLVASGSDSTNHPLQGSVPLIVRNDVLNVHVALQPLVAIPIEVEARHVSTKQTQGPGVLGRAAVMGANSEAHVQYGYFQLIARERWRSAFGGTVSGNIADRGSLPNVTPGRYSLQWTANTPWYVDSVARESTDLLSEDLVVSPGGDQPAIRLLLRDDGATLKPQLRVPADEDQSVTLLVVPDGAPATAIHDYPLPGRGEGYLPPLKPGSYTLIAIDDISDLEYTSAEALAPYLPRGTHITLSAEQTTSVQLDLVRRGSEP